MPFSLFDGEKKGSRSFLIEICKKKTTNPVLIPDGMVRGGGHQCDNGTLQSVRSRKIPRVI